MYTKIKFVSVIMLLALILQMFGSGAKAQTISDASAIVPLNGDASLVAEKVIPLASQKAALKFWTHEALANAQPMEMVDQLGTGEVDQAALLEPQLAGEPGFVPGGTASPNADQIARTAYPKDWKAMEAVTEETSAADFEMEGFGPQGSSQIFTSYIVNLWAPAQTIYPHKWVGRLSFQVPGGTSYCSATSISNNVMLTAAHCVYDSNANKWYSGWVFTPAYRNGSAPYGSFAATTCYVLTAYINLPPGFAINTWTRHDWLSAEWVRIHQDKH